MHINTFWRATRDVKLTVFIVLDIRILRKGGKIVLNRILTQQDMFHEQRGEQERKE